MTGNKRTLEQSSPSSSTPQMGHNTYDGQMRDHHYYGATSAKRPRTGSDYNSLSYRPVQFSHLHGSNNAWPMLPGHNEHIDSNFPATAPAVWSRPPSAYTYYPTTNASASQDGAYHRSAYAHMALGESQRTAYPAEHPTSYEQHAPQPNNGSYETGTYADSQPAMYADEARAYPAGSNTLSGVNMPLDAGMLNKGFAPAPYQQQMPYTTLTDPYPSPHPPNG